MAEKNWRKAQGEGGGETEGQRMKGMCPLVSRDPCVSHEVSEGQPQKMAGLELVCLCAAHTGPATGRLGHAGIVGASGSLEGKWRSRAGALFPVEANCVQRWALLGS